MKKAFTIAEILITLAIIGVVAALTIPSVMINNQKRDLYVRFIKIYSDFSRLMPIIVNEHGSPGTWGRDECYSVIDLLNIKRKFSSNDEVKKILSAKYRRFPNDGQNLSFQVGTFNTMQAVELQSGAIVILHPVAFDTRNPSKYDCLIYVETNGPKGPNAYGRDYFEFVFNPMYNKFLPYDKASRNNFSDSAGGLSNEVLKDYCVNGHNFSASQYYCSHLLLREKAMNY